MFKTTKYLIIASVLLLNACSQVTEMFDAKVSSDFDYNPFSYHTAKVTKDIDLPDYLASNINKEPLYPIPLDKKLKGQVKINKAPPSLADKIVDVE